MAPTRPTRGPEGVMCVNTGMGGWMCRGSVRAGAGGKEGNLLSTPDTFLFYGILKICK